MEVAEVIAGRNNEQCRDRWSDKINRKWTNDEDKALLDAVGNLGTSNWKGVSECLGNRRTEEDVSTLDFSFVPL
jgi:Myb-like DNA-binding domain